MNITIRLEAENDHRRVEEVTREAFWNLFVPGCDEHYLVHVMRHHPDFLPELDFVAVLDNIIVGNIMYTKSRLVDEAGCALPALSFGPVSVLPEYQKNGIGGALIRHSLDQAAAAGHKAVVILGHPRNYCKHGFKGSKDMNVADQNGRFPYGQLVLELEMGCLRDHAWRYSYSNVYNLDGRAAAEFDAAFPPKAKEYRTTQEEFSIACRAYVE